MKNFALIKTCYVVIIISCALSLSACDDVFRNKAEVTPEVLRGVKIVVYRQLLSYVFLLFFLYIDFPVFLYFV